MLSPDLIHVFVYGTLKPGEFYYQHYRLQGQVLDQPAIALGQLYALPVGYPAMTAGAGVVQGFVLSFRHLEILSSLDQLEGYHPHRPVQENEYQRQQIQVYVPAQQFLSDQQLLGSAWVYTMTVDRVEALGGVRILDGCWQSQTGVQFL